MDVDAESPQRPRDASTLTPIDEPMQDAHGEIGLGQTHDPQYVQKQVVGSTAGPSAVCVGKAPIVEASTSRHDWDIVTPKVPHNLG